MVASLALTLNWEIQELARLQQAIQVHGTHRGWDLVFQTQVGLVVEELVVNVMLHGADSARDTVEPGWVRVELVEDGALITLVVTDNGAAFDPTQTPAPDLNAPLESRDRGGLGVHLIRELTDTFSYRRTGGCNVVTVQKRRGQSH
jgi:anti-sigma regulatory factor (Ser/Thr protein kinase)